MGYATIAAEKSIGVRIVSTGNMEIIMKSLRKQKKPLMGDEDNMVLCSMKKVKKKCKKENLVCR